MAQYILNHYYNLRRDLRSYSNTVITRMVVKSFSTTVEELVNQITLVHQNRSPEQTIIR